MSIFDDATIDWYPTAKDPERPTSTERKEGVWRFRKHKVNADSEAIEQAAGSPTDPKYGLNYSYALLLRMSDSWEGPEFTVPSSKKLPDGNPHPHAGQVPPLTEETLRSMVDEPTVASVLKFVSPKWAGRTADEQAAFRDQLEGAARPIVSRAQA